MTFVFALESLFKTSGYRLSLRCGYHIGVDEDEREKVAQDIEEAYKLRNVIVHGGTPDKEVVGQLIPKIEEYARFSIVKFLRSHDHEHLLEKLEKNIRRGV